MNFIKESVHHVIFNLKLGKFRTEIVLTIASRNESCNSLMQDFHYSSQLTRFLCVSSGWKSVLNECWIVHWWRVTLKLLRMRIQNLFIISVRSLFIMKWTHVKLLLRMNATHFVFSAQLSYWCVNGFNINISNFDASVIVDFKWLINDFGWTFDCQAFVRTLIWYLAMTTNHRLLYFFFLHALVFQINS